MACYHSSCWETIKQSEQQLWGATSHPSAWDRCHSVQMPFPSSAGMFHLFQLLDAVELRKHLLVPVFLHLSCSEVSGTCLIINISYHRVSSPSMKVIPYQLTHLERHHPSFQDSVRYSAIPVCLTLVCLAICLVPMCNI